MSANHAVSSEHRQVEALALKAVDHIHFQNLDNPRIDEGIIPTYEQFRQRCNGGARVRIFDESDYSSFLDSITAAIHAAKSGNPFYDEDDAGTVAKAYSNKFQGHTSQWGVWVEPPNPGDAAAGACRVRFVYKRENLNAQGDAPRARHGGRPQYDRDWARWEAVTVVPWTRLINGPTIDEITKRNGATIYGGWMTTPLRDLDVVLSNHETGIFVFRLSTGFDTLLIRVESPARGFVTYRPATEKNARKLWRLRTDKEALESFARQLLQEGAVKLYQGQGNA